MSATFYPLARDSSLCQKHQAELQTADQVTHYREMGYDVHKSNWVGSAWNTHCTVRYASKARKEISSYFQLSPHLQQHKQGVCTEPSLPGHGNVLYCCCYCCCCCRRLRHMLRAERWAAPLCSSTPGKAGCPGAGVLGGERGG